MAIKFENVTIAYDKHPAVHHLTGEFAKGSMTAVIGPNGAGKTTIIKAIAGLKKIEGGSINSSFEPNKISYIPQQANIQKDFPLAVIDFIQFAYLKSRGIFKGFSKKMKEKAVDNLRSVGLSGFEHRTLDTLSAGQFQRVLFARAMLEDANLILLDEPFSAIDEKTSSALLGLLCKWNKQGKTIIAVMHDMDAVRQSFPQTLLLARECLHWGETKKVLTPQNINKARSMMEAWDETAEICEV